MPKEKMTRRSDATSATTDEKLPGPMREENCYTVVYTCGCGAEDRVRFFKNEAPMPAINCWKCGSGRNQPLALMMASGNGMFPPTGHSPAAQLLQ